MVKEMKGLVNPRAFYVLRLLCQELQVLQSIYLEELEISREDRVELRITLHPATGDDAEIQYVRLTLHLSLPPQYPDDPPDISVSNPRGLCDEQIHSITDMLRRTAAESVGGPLLYELIEKGKEMLTASNIPRGHCVICLYGFQEGDSLTKTPCFHHFHSHCLGRLAKHCLEEEPEQDSVVLCPVCRENLTCDFNKLEEAPPPQQPEERYVPDSRTIQREADLRQIYERQMVNGGIIDVEAERNRFFISIQEAPPSDDAIFVPDETQDSAQQTGPTSCQEQAPPPVTSKHHVFASDHRGAGLRAKAQPMQRDYREGQHWRGGGRGWTGRPRLDNRRGWRDEEGHRDFPPQTRGRGKTRGFHSNRTERLPLRGASDNVQEEKGAL